MSKSFMPTLAEVYLDTRRDMAVKPANALSIAKSRLAIWREAFPDRIEGNKLARFLLAKEATGARFNRLIPAWAKTLPPPKPARPWAGQPPRFPAWVYFATGAGQNLPAALAFFVFEVIFKMGLPGFEPGSSGPKPEILQGYTTTP